MAGGELGPSWRAPMNWVIAGAREVSDVNLLVHVTRDGSGMRIQCQCCGMLTLSSLIRQINQVRRVEERWVQERVER